MRFFTGTGDCDGTVKGTNGQPIKVPCDCPPDRATFIKVRTNTSTLWILRVSLARLLTLTNQHLQDLNANVAAGHVLNNPVVPISFPEDNSTASQLARLNAASETLQNLNGSGKGCPIASTTFQAQVAGINNAGTQPASPASPSPPPSSQTPTSNDAGTPTALSARSTPSVTPAINNTSSPTVPSASSSSVTAAQINALAPQLGFTAGKNPTGKSLLPLYEYYTFSHPIMVYLQAPAIAMAQ
jgi:hypothetical protein